MSIRLYVCYGALGTAMCAYFLNLKFKRHCLNFGFSWMSAGRVAWNSSQERADAHLRELALEIDKFEAHKLLFSLSVDGSESLAQHFKYVCNQIGELERTFNADLSRVKESGLVTKPGYKYYLENALN